MQARSNTGSIQRSKLHKSSDTLKQTISSRNSGYIKQKKQSIVSSIQPSYQQTFNLFKNPSLLTTSLSNYRKQQSSNSKPKANPYISLRSMPSQSKVKNQTITSATATKKTYKKLNSNQKKPLSILRNYMSGNKCKHQRNQSSLSSSVSRSGMTSLQTMSRNSHYNSVTMKYINEIVSFNPSIQESAYQTYNFQPPQQQQQQPFDRYRQQFQNKLNEKSQTANRLNNDLNIEYFQPCESTDTYDLLNKYRRQKLSSQTSEYMNTLLSRVKTVMTKTIEMETKKDHYKKEALQEELKKKQVDRLEQVKADMRESLIETNLSKAIFKKESRQKCKSEDSRQQSSTFTQCVQHFSERVEQIIQDQRLKRKSDQLITLQDTTAEVVNKQKPKQPKNERICRQSKRKSHSKENKVVEEFKDKIKKVHLFEKQKQNQSLKHQQQKPNAKDSSKKFIDSKIVQSKSNLTNKENINQRKGSLIDLINNYESSNDSSSVNSPTRDLPPWTREAMLNKVRSIRM